MAASALSVDMVMSLQLDDGTRMPVDATLRYRPDDPYAVAMDFSTPQGPVTWHVARDLLVTGLTSPAGTGDVKVAPLDPGHGMVIWLSTPDGQALLTAHREQVDSFLSRTYRLVPLGREARHLDLDALVHRLLDVA